MMICITDSWSLVHGYGNTLEEAIDNLRNTFHEHYALLRDREDLTPYLVKTRDYLREVLEDEILECPDCGEVFSSLPDSYERKVKREFDSSVRRQRRENDLLDHAIQNHGTVVDADEHGMIG